VDLFEEFELIGCPEQRFCTTTWTGGHQLESVCTLLSNDVKFLSEKKLPDERFQVL
jgi:hypothetical protein